MVNETVSVFDFLPELFGVLIGTVIGYFLASRASNIASKKNIVQTKNALLDEVKHNQNSIKRLTDKTTFINRYHISRPFRKSSYQNSNIFR